MKITDEFLRIVYDGADSTRQSQINLLGKDQWPFLFVSLVKVAYISLDISLDNCTISVLERPL